MMHPMAFRFFLGLDGGGSLCRARLTDQNGTTIGEAESGSCNIRLGTKTAWASINTAIDLCLRKAGLDEAKDRQNIRAVFGLAGFAQTDDPALLSHTHGLGSLTVTSDAHIACTGAFGETDGAILILGTGSAGYGRVNGREVSVGGWGFEVSDHGSGSWIGRKAVEYALLALDGLWEKTPLTGMIMESFNHDPKAVVSWTSTARPKNYASLAPTVFDAEQRHDTTARMIIDAAARDTSAMIQRLVELGAPSVCLSGGISSRLEPFLTPQAKSFLHIPLADPLAGAILLARRVKEE